MASATNRYYFCATEANVNRFTNQISLSMNKDTK
ncbi:hypothetical protein BVRB_6g128850 [Beta vulgaris subsp. vulgaris]|nr:hypothetical protein BVRB_6g128850 [Beta vulgaris subsp. vulgaris]